MALYASGESRWDGRKQVAASGAACSERVPRVHVPVCEELWRSDEPERNVNKHIIGVHKAAKRQIVNHFRYIWFTCGFVSLWSRRKKLWRHIPLRLDYLYGLRSCTT
jgi:hypothetical protein